MNFNIFDFDGSCFHGRVGIGQIPFQAISEVNKWVTIFVLWYCLPLYSFRPTKNIKYLRCVRLARDWLSWYRSRDLSLCSRQLAVLPRVEGQVFKSHVNFYIWVGRSIVLYQICVISYEMKDKYLKLWFLKGVLNKWNKKYMFVMFYLLDSN